ncbi:MAG: hypothetical protein R6U96_05445 [Promethearchaeia archaeon]
MLESRERKKISFQLYSFLLLNPVIYLIGAWYNRVVMGALIGLAGEIRIYKGKDSIPNSIFRGALIGAFVSAGFAFFQQTLTITYLFAGIGFGALNDVVTTRLTKSANKE